MTDTISSLCPSLTSTTASGNESSSLHPQIGIKDNKPKNKKLSFFIFLVFFKFNVKFEMKRPVILHR